MIHKGILVTPIGNHGLLYRSYHLLGLETPILILTAGRLNLSTGSTEVIPRVDLVAMAGEDLRAGSVFSYDGNHRLSAFEPLIFPTSPAAADNPIPLYMGVGQRLKKDVRAGSGSSNPVRASVEPGGG